MFAVLNHSGAATCDLLLDQDFLSRHVDERSQDRRLAAQ
jgi:hypothetical protein